VEKKSAKKSVIDLNGFKVEERAKEQKEQGQSEKERAKKKERVKLKTNVR
jgi:hypothetical protein